MISCGALVCLFMVQCSIIEGGSKVQAVYLYLEV